MTCMTSREHDRPHLLRLIALLFAMFWVLPGSALAVTVTLDTKLSPDRVRYRVVGAEAKEEDGAVTTARREALRQAGQDLTGSNEEKDKVARFLLTTCPPDVLGFATPGQVLRRNFAGDNLQISMFVEVDVKQLTVRLERERLVKSHAELAEGVGNPTVLVMPAALAGQGPAQAGTNFGRIINDRLASQLTERQWNLVDAAAVANAQKQMEALHVASGGGPDAVSQLAAVAGADISLAWSIVFSDRDVQATASVTAYETATGQQLGASTKMSKTYGADTPWAQASLEAITSAVGPLLENISGYWHKAATEGRRIKLVVRGDFSDRDRYKRIRDQLHTLGKAQDMKKSENEMSCILLTTLNRDDLEDGLVDCVKAGGFKGVREILVARAIMLYEAL